MSVSASSKSQPFSGPAYYDPVSGFVSVNGVIWPDGTVQSTGADNLVAGGALASKAFPAASETITLTTNFIEGTPIVLDFDAGRQKAIKTGGSYVAVCKVKIGGNGTSFNQTDLEQVVCRFECQVVATGGSLSNIEFGAQNTIPAIYAGSNFIPTITTETLITLPDPPAGETWSKAQVTVTLASNETSATTSTVVGYQDLTVSIFQATVAQ